MLPTRGFARSLSGKPRRIIAEVKKASPSKGLIRADFEPVAIAKDYAAHGASAISVLTEERFFQGSLAVSGRDSRRGEVPLLRKDFMLDPYQIVEAKSYGADAVLFIAAHARTQPLMRELWRAGDARWRWMRLSKCIRRRNWPRPSKLARR